MPRAVAEAVHDTATQAAGKAAASRRIGSYLVSGVLAGAYVGIAVVLLINLSAPFAAAGSPATRLIQAAVFGLALTLVVFAGAELFTGNVMVMAQGWRAGTAGWRSAGRVNGLAFVGNAAGSLALAAMVHASGVLDSGGRGDGQGAGAGMLAAVVNAKNEATGSELFWRAVLCNALVCLALWMASRATSDGAKLAVLWWGLLAFIGSGFEHSVANMTTFSLAALAGSAGWSDLVANLVWTVPGNVLGGLLVAVAYAWTTRLPGRPSASADGGLAAPAPRAAADA